MTTSSKVKNEKWCMVWSEDLKKEHFDLIVSFGYDFSQLSLLSIWEFLKGRSGYCIFDINIYGLDAASCLWTPQKGMKQYNSFNEFLEDHFNV